MSASHKLTQSILVLLFLIGFASVARAADPGSLPTLGKTGPATAIAGNNITYTIPLTNGNVPYNMVTITDALPAGTTFVSVSVNPAANWTCSTPAVGANGTVSCS